MKCEGEWRRGEKKMAWVRRDEELGIMEDC